MKRLPMLLAVFIIYWSLPVIAATMPQLALGDKGTAVGTLQQRLYILGYTTDKPTGVFDQKTDAAVRAFQKDQNLTADGIVGKHSWDKLDQLMAGIPVYIVEAGDTLWKLAREYGIDVDRLILANNLTAPDKISIGQKILVPVPTGVPDNGSQSGAKVNPPVAANPKPAEPTAAGNARGAELVSWADVHILFKIGTTATVTDCASGLSFKVKRLYGHEHADVEPLTANDTATMKKIYGGKWSWDRKAVVVTIAGRRIAGSINGMPHGNASITTNQFPGHFCIHFLDSGTHSTGKPDKLHQQAVLAAAGYTASSVVAKK